MECLCGENVVFRVLASVCIREYITYSRIPLMWQPLDQTGAGFSYVPDYQTVPPLT